MATTVEESLELDIGMLTDIAEEKGALGTLTWSAGDDVVASINYHYHPTGDAFQLTYTVNNGARSEPADVSDTVPLEYTPANLGGERPWFSCPTCGTRRAKLYKPPRRERFRCRECHGLLYESQTYTSELTDAFDQMDQAQRRLEREGVTEEALRMFYEASEAALDRVDDRCRDAGHDDLAGDDVHDESFEEWAEQLLGEALDPRYRWHGRCEATAQTTGQRCLQPATGDHRKCYYHGGAEGSGAPEDNQNAAVDGEHRTGDAAVAGVEDAP